MGSYQFLNHSSNQVRDSFSSCCSSSSNNNNIRRGFSKSQMCLQKILQIITSYPPQNISPNHQIQEFDENRVVGIDLNMEYLCEADEQDEEVYSESLMSNCSVVVDDNKVVSNDSENKINSKNNSSSSSSEVECDPSSTEEQKDLKKKDFLDGLFGEKNNSDCLSILIEAAEMVSGNMEVINKEDEEEEEEDNNNNHHHNQAEGKFESVKDKSLGVVSRSKRGRSHVLPSRYRDSVLLEPWKKLPRRPPPPPEAATAAAAGVISPSPVVSTRRGKLKNNNKKIK